ncbi:transposase [Bhargavaea massiliensis]|uniref:transposase n=1 Tax=Bhargavaea massiliensis TaxID=2697500 RepID=UPI003AF7E241
MPHFSTLLAQCTQSQNHVKVITRHIWQDYLDHAEAIRLTPENKEIYTRRKETVERGFGDAKEKCGMRWTTLAGDAYFCCLEPEEIGQLDLEVTRTGLTAGHPKGFRGKKHAQYPRE